jgi:hypothetical protein
MKTLYERLKSEYKEKFETETKRDYPTTHEILTRELNEKKFVDELYFRDAHQLTLMLEVDIRQINSMFNKD